MLQIQMIKENWPKKGEKTKKSHNRFRCLIVSDKIRPHLLIEFKDAIL